MLRNRQCGHVLAIATVAHRSRLYTRMATLTVGEWQVATERNTAELYDHLMKGPCVTCRQRP